MKDNTIWQLIFEAKKEAFQKGYPLTMPVFGWSMLPFLAEGDKITIVECEGKKLRSGDIAVFKNDGFIAHRIIRKINNKSGLIFITKGDTRLHFDKPIPENAIVGKIVKIDKHCFIIDLEGIPGRVLNIASLFLSLSQLWSAPFLLVRIIDRLLRRKKGKE